MNTLITSTNCADNSSNNKLHVYDDGGEKYGISGNSLGQKYQVLDQFQIKTRFF